jgi:hypothetical protein
MSNAAVGQQFKAERVVNDFHEVAAQMCVVTRSPTDRTDFHVSVIGIRMLHLVMCAGGESPPRKPARWGGTEWIQGCCDVLSRSTCVAWGPPEGGPSVCQVVLESLIHAAFREIDQRLMRALALGSVAWRLRANLRIASLAVHQPRLPLVLE